MIWVALRVSLRGTGKNSSKSFCHSHQKAVANGRPIRRAYMPTSAQPGIDVAAKLEAILRGHHHSGTPQAWTRNINDDLAGPESISISLDEIDAAFALLEHKKDSEAMEQVLDDGNEVLEGQVYHFAELEHVDQGLLSKSVDNDG